MRDRFRPLLWPRLATLLLLLGGLAESAFAQTDAAPESPASNGPSAVTTANGPSAVPTIEDLNTRRQKVEALTDIDEAEKKTVLETFDQAIEQVQRAEKQSQLEASYLSQQDEARRTATELQQQLSQPEPPVAVEYTDDESVVQLEQRLATARATLADARKESTRLEAEPARRAQRRTEVPAEIDKAKQRLTEVERALATEPSSGELPIKTEATRTLLLTQKQALTQTIDTLELELTTYDQTVDFTRSQRDLAQRKVSQSEKIVSALQKAVEDRRFKQAAEQAQSAREIAEQTSLPELRQLAEENAALAERHAELAIKISAADKSAEALSKQVAGLKEDRAIIEQKLDIPGINDILGPQLLSEKRELPDTSAHHRNIRARTGKAAEAQLEKLRVEERLRDLPETETELPQIMAGISMDDTDLTQKQVEDQVGELLQSRRKLLDELRDSYNSYVNALTDVSAKERSLVDETTKSSQLLDKHVLWVRSATPLDWRQLTGAWSAARWLFSPEQWRNLVSLLGVTIVRRAIVAGAAILLILFVYLLERPMHAKLQEVGELVKSSLFQPFQFTVLALLLTLVLSAVAPGIVYLVGWYLANRLAESEFARAIGGGLMTMAAAYFTAELVRQVTRSNGLAEAHFRWSKVRLRRIRRHLTWLIALGLPAIFLVGVFEYNDSDAFRNSLGRLALMAVQLLLALFLWRVLEPDLIHSGRNSSTVAQREQTPRWKQFSYMFVVLAPALLAILAGLGWYYTSLQFSYYLMATAWLFLSLTVLQATAVRWLRLARGKLAIEQIKKQRQAEAEEPVAGEEGAVLDSERLEVKEPATDLAAINTQTRRLLRLFIGCAAAVGLWLIWDDVLPALTFLNVRLWDTTVSRFDMETLKWESLPEPITLGHVLLAILVAVATYVASRNLPGLLEVSILQALPLDPGARYALTTVARYTINAVGVVAAFWIIGIEWSKVQWLVAAVGVGLGFGLQEIFANFVSGIILLAERPIRVGDIVTIGDVTGAVTRIRIRATTICDWDRKEFIVPNKELVTGQLTNWTLTDKINRIVIPVGIAYGSDTDRARELLFGILRDNPIVLNDPVPLVTFEGFGDSTLNFVVRAYLPDLQNRLETVHQLHTTIHRVFGEQGIEIAFPQRDIHVRSVDGVRPVVESLKGNGARVPDGAEAAVRAGESEKTKEGARNSRD